MALVNTPDKYVFGRPAKYDLKAEAKALLEWIERPENLRLVSFANERNFLSTYFKPWADEDEDFSYALQKAKDVLADRREKLANEGVLNYGIFQRSQLCYDHIQKTTEREEKAYDASLRIKVETNQQECNAQSIAKAVKDINDSSK